jgi:hypothetical protein
MMNKYLSLEEQQAFWTDLFAVTIRYEQRRYAAAETYPDSIEGRHQSDAMAEDHSIQMAPGSLRNWLTRDSPANAKG